MGSLSVASRIGLVSALSCAAIGLGAAAVGAERESDETTFSKAVVKTVFPGELHVGPIAGVPPAAPVYRDGRLAGYVFSTRTVGRSAGFSGKPIDIVVGLDTSGHITGALLRRHSEPILIIGIADADLRRYVQGFAGLDIRASRLAETAPKKKGMPDAISGASISSAVIFDAILASARSVARARGIIGTPPTGRLDRETYAAAGWPDLIADGSLVGKKVTAGAPADGAVARVENVIASLYLGLATSRRIGENLLGTSEYGRLMASIGPDDNAIFIAGDGLWSFKGTAYVRTGAFDRIQVLQGDRTIRLRRELYRNVERLAADGAPEFREAGIFALPADSGFDPLKPWRLSLLIDLDAARPTTIDIPYTLPARYRAPAITPPADTTSAVPVEERPLWQRIWAERPGRIAILSTMLLILSGILVFQNSLVRRYRLYRAVRLTFLGATLLWLGWYAGAQLSVVNVLTFAHSLLTDFHWEFFLIDPLIFILWSYVAVTLLFWGRGVFCGWLCPFGALQELINEAARKLKVPQLRAPFGLHERLWPIKYILFLGLFALSLHSMTNVIFGAEIEPFKTAITLKFARAWPFVVYAAAILFAALFIERFFCRYLCPLGAALAIPARLRMFEWLKRRHQCGSECHICAQRCTVQAIHPDGSINPNECIHCLNCQTVYVDDKTCPPLVMRRRRREARRALGDGTPADWSFPA